MDKMKRKSIPAALLPYLIPCFLVCAAGVWIITLLSDYMLSWYIAKKETLMESMLEERTYIVDMPAELPFYRVISCLKYILAPAWAVLCLWAAVRIYYRREIKAPIEVLAGAAEKILNDDLDFKVESPCGNELGRLCSSFETMRNNLYDSNYVLWKSLEERKRLNSSFSHDLRTPITVLKGYTELIRQYDGRLGEEKLRDIMEKMSGQIDRLERYTDKMSSIHKLEDIIPEEGSISFGELCSRLRETGALLCGDTEYVFSAAGDEAQVVYTDAELVMQVFENLVSNALRYTADRMACRAELSEGELAINVSDNGRGFSEEALRKAWHPFYRDGSGNEKEHFGLGLYICSLLCRKCGGRLAVANGENGGGSVTAFFSAKKSESR